MTSPIQPITVCCPHCNLYYEDWWRPSINFALDHFGDDYLEAASTATCPRCSTKVHLGTLENSGEDLIFREPSWEPPTSLDYVQYYDLEGYLFSIVPARYDRDKTLSAFDFFSIVVWKANRAKSRIATRLLKYGGGQENLEVAVAKLMAAISQANEPKERLSVLIELWGFRLPMASAILTVLFPNEFTVYDVRVCEELGDFKDADTNNFAVQWERYSAYIAAVRSTAPEYPRLRDKDRYLWGKSATAQLRSDIESCFRRGDSDVDR